MTKDEDFKLLKIQTCVLKVNIHCDGCKQKVKKLLQRIEGVYQVNIDADQQKVTVSGTVDAATLIKKLVRAGKHAEVWSQKSNQNQKPKNNCIKDDKNNNNNNNNNKGQIKGLEAFKNPHQQKFPLAFSEEDEDYLDEDEEDEEDYLGFLRAAELGLLRQQQQAIDPTNARKGIAGIAAASNNNGGNKMHNHVGNGNAGKKGNPNQNMGMKMIPGGIDQRTMAALKMSSNGQLGGGNINAGEAKRGSDLATMMNLAGFHGNGPNPAPAATALGGNPSGLGGLQVQSNNAHQGSSAAAAAGWFPSGGYVTGQYPSTMLTNMNGYNHPAASSMMMNMQNRQAMHHQQQPQPQMMYHKSPLIPPSTGYYHSNYSPAPYYEQPSYYSAPSPASSAAAATSHMFSDENTSSCSIM